MSAPPAPRNGSAINEAPNGKPVDDISDSAADSDASDDSDLISEDADGDDDDARVLSAYRHLLSRRVDLVGDYAGDELFLIEGDSLLLRCFGHDKLDFDLGCQLLHAVYNVEHFLANLVQRKCNFSLVFFTSNAHLCIPSTAQKANDSKYLLARAALIRHLQSNLKAHPQIAIRQFPSWSSPDFLQYLHTTSPYFLMAHDGALPVDRRSKHVVNDTDTMQQPASRAPLRRMILSFIARGFNVALVNGLEWRDTKVMTMVLEPRRKTERSLLENHDAGTAHGLAGLDVSEKLTKLDASDLGLTARQSLLAITVSELLEGAEGTKMEARLGAALLLHQALLSHMPLNARRSEATSASDEAQSTLRAACKVAAAILSGDSWDKASGQSTCDVSDAIDGRLFLLVCEAQPSVSTEVKATFDKLLRSVEMVLRQADLPEADVTVTSSPSNAQPGANGAHDRDLAVLPFSNHVFDKHLEPVRIRVDAAAESERSLAARRIFQEVSHWHNYKRPLVPKAVKTAADAKQEFFAARRNQWFMAEMRDYAASLTNAIGKTLEPETIIVGAVRKPKAGAESPVDSDASDSGTSTSSKKPGQKKGGGKTAAKNAGKQAMLNQIAAAKAKKDESTGDKIASSWQVVCKGFEADSDPRSRYRRAREYLINLQASWREVIGPEIELYLLNCLVCFWIDACRKKEGPRRIQVAALAWSHARSIAQRGQLTKTILKCLTLTVDTLGLPSLPKATESGDRKLAFTFVLPTKADSLKVNMSPKEFQLVQCGPYLERSFDSRPDHRVDFQPDGWQRNVLDGIDKDQSVFVVAPTSAGKTFISFYAMRKVLEADDESVLVYVAPTKALVNQIAAEIQARYSKKFKYGGKSVWAIHTRDYRINNPTGCQVLVTVPHVLQIMLLAPSNANSWSSRVKRIIFDEIHSIGQAEDGVVWEQLLLMAPCPIIALSATVGNPEEFSGWLATTQRAIGKELLSVKHPYRYSDLRKYYYVPPKRFTFQGIPDKSAFGSLGLEGLKGFNFIHPVAGLVDKSRGIPEDLALEPRDCLILWRAMDKLQDEKHPVPASLNPDKALPEVSRKVDILKWEKSLKQILADWISDATSPYDRLVKELEHSFQNEDRDDAYSTGSGSIAAAKGSLDPEDLKKTTLPMLCRLQEQDALPAILFNYDRHDCEKICRAVVEQLAQAELKQKKSGPKWEKTLERWEEWKELKEKTASRTSKAANKKTSKKSKDDDADDEKGSKLDAQRDAAGGEDTKWESFDPEAPFEGFHFADHTKVQTSDFERYIRQLRRRDVQPWLIEALSRGVGIHHAGMNRKYRQVVEILFRKQFLRVIIATGTLALGINMPCKTVVFSGDSVFLTALNYRQCAGRAGRRGFDLLGNVVFQGVSRQKVCRLISSRLPDLNGHFPITTTLVLRLFTLLHESKNSKYAVSAINALLSQPRLYMGGPSFKDEVMHHLRFSIEYLRRQQLLGSDGAPLNFAGLVSHLYFTENSSFAFHALLKEGYFHELCANIAKNEQEILETLMLVMSHLFNRRECRQADSEYREKVVKPSSSIVFLPPMPKQATKILTEHNQQTLRVYKAYVETFVNQHVKHQDRVLPLSGLKAGAESGTIPSDLQTLPPTQVRSSFVALSGHGDDFESIHDLCQTTRDGVFLEEAVIPHMDVYPEEMKVPLNAYLLDFFKHGDVMTIERANGVRRADIWFLLNDFSLVLATIMTSLMNFMKLSEGSDMDMLDIMGRMDAHEEEEDDKIAAVEEQQSEASGPSIADSGISGMMPERPKTAAAPTKKQSKNAESWEDLAGDDDDDADGADSTARRELGEQAEALAQELSAWEGEGGEGLKNVLKAFQKLHAEFNIKFKAMWA
ncbi:P-loop containing nucleoside triphosphate hydrolase [Lecanosticta acicola]|uniref:P-loop containing nucleoside triphosphate hydrolase n=1 Tax=Lecanosticta acicola TaxID=111012 RepID=A0AAI8YY71_9PEZI|nr:P-loop containing nucleoside triphosphate hydrolase [Lecanosticta acicola]